MPLVGGRDTVTWPLPEPEVWRGHVGSGMLFRKAPKAWYHGRPR